MPCMELFDAVMERSPNRRTAIEAWIARENIPVADRFELYKIIERNKRRYRDYAIMELEGAMDEIHGGQKRAQAANMILEMDEATIVPLLYPNIPALEKYAPDTSCMIFRCVLGHADERAEDLLQLVDDLRVAVEDREMFCAAVEQYRDTIRQWIPYNIRCQKEVCEALSKRRGLARTAVTEAVQSIQ